MHFKIYNFTTKQNQIILIGCSGYRIFILWQLAVVRKFDVALIYVV